MEITNRAQGTFLHPALRQDVPYGRCQQPQCQEWDTLSHALLHCPEVQRVWEWVAQLWVAVRGGAPPPLTQAVILCGRTHPVWAPGSPLWGVLRAVALGCLHHARKRAFASGQLLAASRVACRIVAELRQLVMSDWVAATRSHAVRRLYGVPCSMPADVLLSRFDSRWGSMLGVCSVHDGHLLLHLTPQFPVPVPM